jgi:uncharacterized protein (DUF488 family)
VPHSSEIYTLGYAAWTVEEVVEQAQTLDAILVDVRRAPYTTKPGFKKEELRSRFGDRYVHIPGFGNVNYEGGPIELAQPEEGLDAIRALSRPPILMCGCTSPTQCHRSTVATLLAEQMDADVTHLRSPSERAQPDLFEGQ